MQKLERPDFITKKIGSTYYAVNVYSSNTSKETFSDKLLRLVKADTAIAHESEAILC